MFKVGDKVWSNEFNWGTVIGTEENFDKNVVIVEFESITMQFSADGKMVDEFWGNVKFRSLFFEETEISAEEIKEQDKGDIFNHLEEDIKYFIEMKKWEETEKLLSEFVYYEDGMCFMDHNPEEGGSRYTERLCGIYNERFFGGVGRFKVSTKTDFLARIRYQLHLEELTETQKKKLISIIKKLKPIPEYINKFELEVFHFDKELVNKHFEKVDGFSYRRKQGAK
ncbi:MAG: hypothetical protein ACRC6E_14610 [Fusobacteriaceae bacterium]